MEVSERRMQDLETDCKGRYESIREEVRAAVQESMPRSIISDEEIRWIKMAIQRERERGLFRKKVIESTAIWAVPVLIALFIGLWWELLKSYAAAHGWGKP